MQKSFLHLHILQHNNYRPHQCSSLSKRIKKNVWPFSLRTVKLHVIHPPIQIYITIVSGGTPSSVPATRGQFAYACHRRAIQERGNVTHNGFMVSYQHAICICEGICSTGPFSPSGWWSGLHRCPGAPQCITLSLLRLLNIPTALAKTRHQLYMA